VEPTTEGGARQDRFFEGFKLLSWGRFSAAKKLLSEDHTFIFLGSVAPAGYGKILSLLKAKKSPIILGWFHTDFLEINKQPFQPSVLDSYR
jgi:hypothetical protein